MSFTYAQQKNGKEKMTGTDSSVSSRKGAFFPNSSRLEAEEIGQIEPTPAELGH